MHPDVTFNLGPAKVCSSAIFEIYFSYDKYIWIAATTVGTEMQYQYRYQTLFWLCISIILKYCFT